MNRKFLFAALLFTALSVGFTACENPKDEIENPDGNTDIIRPELLAQVATGGATDVEYSSVTLWGRINVDTLLAFSNVKWGVGHSTDKEALLSYGGTKTLCTTDLTRENADEYSVAVSSESYAGKMLYYNAYVLIDDEKYIWDEMDSVHMDVRLTVNPNNTSYGMVTGSGTYDYEAEATITATPKENYYFIGWSDCDSKELTRAMTMTADTTITANFAKKPYLTVASNYGMVTGSGYYMPGEEVTITATPNSGAYFVEWNDGNTDNPRTVTINGDITYTATFAGNPNGTANGYEYVDLGLPSGTKWATCNVGATKPEEYGNYFAWGETEPKTTYNWGTYKWCNGSKSTITKYNANIRYGTVVDGKTQLELADDAARANWGGAWRMPYAEWQELRTNCTWTWTDDYNGTGVAGQIVTSNTNGNSIFLPAAGYHDNYGLRSAGSYGEYWSSSLDAFNPDIAWGVCIGSGHVGNSSERRYCGRSVRPVLGE